MPNPNPFIFGDTPNPCCWPGSGPQVCGGVPCPPIPLDNGVRGFQNVTAFVGGTLGCLDGQYTLGMSLGLIILTKINGFFQEWEVENLGINQQTTVDMNGNYIIIRAADTAITSSVFVALS